MHFYEESNFKVQQINYVIQKVNYFLKSNLVNLDVITKLYVV